MTDKKSSFEESLTRLREYAEKIRKPETGLEESIRCYEEGMKHYEACVKVLDDARQKIQTFDIHTGELEDI